MNVNALIHFVGKLHPVIQNALPKNRSEGIGSSSNGSFPNFMEGYFVLVACKHFQDGGNLFLRLRGPRGILKSMNNCVYRF